jgi:hypothetical protein
VGQLVADHLGGALLLPQAGRGRVEQQQRLSEEDGSRVLHGPELEVGHRHQIQLGVGVGDGEVALEAAEALARGLAPEAHESTLAGRVPDADLGRSHAGGLRGFESTHGQGDEVGRQRRRLREVHPLAAAGESLASDRGGVREHRVGGAGGDGDPEARLHGRLVEAGEELARGGRLELGEGVTPLADRHPVEAAEVCAQLPGEGEAKRRLAPGSRLLELDLDHLQLGVGLDPAAQHPPAGLDARARHAQVGRVEPDPARRAREAECDGHLAPKGASTLRIDLDLKLDPLGPDLRGQAPAARGRPRCGAGVCHAGQGHGPAR